MRSTTALGLRAPLLLAAAAPLGCAPGSTQSPPPTVAVESAPATTPVATPTVAAAAKPSPDERCRQLLERFGARAVEVEQRPCVEAMTSAREKQDCDARGLGDDYQLCFDSCMRSVGISEAEYDENDGSSSPVENCRLGCYQTDCGT